MNTKPHEWIWDNTQKGDECHWYNRETGLQTYYYDLRWKRLSSGQIMLRSMAEILVWPGLEEFF